MDFKCTSCGACCRMANLHNVANKKHWGIELTDIGRCVHLSEDNKCKIYENRPLICNVDEVYDRVEEIKDIEPLIYEEIKKMKNKKEYYKIIYLGCNHLIDSYGIDSSYKIKIDE